MRKPLCFYAASIALATLMPASTWAAQQPQIPGSGTVALPSTVDSEYGFTNKVVVKTKEGAAYLFRFTRDLLLHGGKGLGLDPLRELREGSTVVVTSDTNASNKDASRPTAVNEIRNEGTVLDVDHRQRIVTIRFENRQTATFRLADSASPDPDKAAQEAEREPGRVVISYIDDMGRPIDHYFRKTS